VIAGLSRLLMLIPDVLWAVIISIIYRAYNKRDGSIYN
jgi:hypothetical protein